MTEANEHCLTMVPPPGVDVAPACVVIVPPLFDEANRMRRTLVMASRILSTNGLIVMIPDLPGQNESIIGTVAVSLTNWRNALADFVAQQNVPVLLASMRGGALIDGGTRAAAHWRLNPAKGASLLRTMLRTKIAGEREAGRTISMDDLMAEARRAPIELAGNTLSPAMIAQLQDAVPDVVAPLRGVDVGDDIAGSALWLRAEPGEDAAMATAMAQDMLDWMRTCGVI